MLAGGLARQDGDDPTGTCDAYELATLSGGLAGQDSVDQLRVVLAPR